MFCFHMPAFSWGKDACGYIFMTMYSFVPPFRETKVCGVSSCVFDKLERATDEESLQNTGVENSPAIHKGDRSVLANAPKLLRYAYIF
jgi:hypothetical protein